MKLYSWNVNGIRAVLRKELFFPFIEECQPDILCLQETKAQPGDVAVDLPGYEEYWNSAARKGYSGTALYAKTKPMQVMYNLPLDLVEKYSLNADAFGDPSDEGRVLVAEFPNTYVATVYTPNAKDDLGRLAFRKENWDPAFLEYMQRLEQKKPVIFCGDLNVAHTELDLANPKPNIGKKGFTDEERSGFQAFLDAGFIDTFRMFHQGNGFYTWWSHMANARSRNVGWRIDYFLVSQKLSARVKNAAIHPTVMGSDHCPVSVEIEGEL